MSSDDWERPGIDDDFGPDARIRRLENDALADDHEARAELLRALARSGVGSGWAFVWDHPATHVLPAEGAIRVDVWAPKDDSQPRRRLARNTRGAWAVAAVDLSDLFRILRGSQVFAKGWLVDMATGAALVTHGIQQLEPLIPLDVYGGIQGQLTDFLEETLWRPRPHSAADLRARFGVDDLRSLVAQAVATPPATADGLSWAWGRSISGAAVWGSASFFVIAVKTPTSVVVGVPPANACGISPGVVHEHSGRVRRDPSGAAPYEVFVSQPPPAGTSCPACGWTAHQHVVLERDRSHERLAAWVGTRGQDRIRIGLAEAAAWAGVVSPAGSVT